MRSRRAPVQNTRNPGGPDSLNPSRMAPGVGPAGWRGCSDLRGSGFPGTLVAAKGHAGRGCPLWSAYGGITISIQIVVCTIAIADAQGSNTT